MKTSHLFFKTQKETPADCDIVSHQLMERSGLIRRLSRGLYSYTPVMWRIMKKLMNIMREELEKEGSQEVLLPQLQPEQIWEDSGRLARYKAENLLYCMEDREQGKYCLGPTHEEVVTLLVKNWLTSYKQLPVNLYQIGNKFRDEIRPRFGLMRAKEFIMKDAYSFCATIEQMNDQYEAMRRAYRRIFDRLSINYAIVQADGGSIGKGRSEEFQVLADAGEDSILVTDTHAANVEALSVAIESKPYSEELQTARVMPTPATDSIIKLCECLKIQDWEILKTVLYRASYGDREEFVAVCIRGDRDVNDVKLKNLLDCLDVELASLEDLQRIAGVQPGFLGPRDLAVKTLGDHSIESMRNFVVAINQNDCHLIHANWGRDIPLPTIHDLLLARAGDLHPIHRTPYKAFRGIEVGHIFNLGDKYSSALGATFTNAQGRPQAMMMGCYGIGVGRLAAAIIEQRHDEKGIIWPLEIAPFSCTLSAAKANDALLVAATESIYNDLQNMGVEVLLDDRDERLGLKMKDSDLLGIPYKIIVGAAYTQASQLEIEPRLGQKYVIDVSDLERWVKDTLIIK